MKKLKRVLCISLIVVLMLSTFVFASNMEAEAPALLTETALGESSPVDLPVVASTFGTATTKKFVNHPNWIEISDAQSTELYNQDKPFIVFYYKTTCGYSQSRARWTEQWMSEYDIPVYGVMLYDSENESVYSSPSWARQAIIKTEKPSVYPIMTFVVNKKTVVSHMGLTDRAVVEADMRKVVAALNPTGQAPTTWNGKANIQSGQHLRVESNLLITNTVIIEKGASVTVAEGVTITVDSSTLSVQGELKGPGRTIATGNNSVIAGNGSAQNVFYTISVAGGTASKYLAQKGEVVTLTPDPSNQVFERWTFQGSVGNLKGNDVTIGYSSLNAIPVYEKNTTVLVVPATIPANGGTVNLAHGVEYLIGESITLAATPSPGYKFKEWDFQGRWVSDKTANPITWKMPKEQLVARAIFETTTTPSPATYPITINDSAGGATSFQSGNNHLSGANIHITAIPKLGYQFKEWQVSGVSISNTTTNPFTFTMPSAGVTVTPVFKPSSTPVHPTNKLSIFTVFGGSTNGTSAAYPANETISVTATPLAGYKFHEWRITGMATSRSQENPIILTMPNRDISLTPVFVSENTPTPPITTPTNPPTGNTGSSSGGSGSGGGSGGGGGGGGGTINNTSTSTSSPQPEKVTEKIAGELATNAIRKATDKNKVILPMLGKSEIDALALQKMRSLEQSEKVKLLVHADQNQNNTTRLRLTFSPSAIPSGQAIRVDDSTSRANTLHKRFSSYFKNKFAVLSLKQEGEFGTSVRVAMKLPKEINAENIIIYFYNKEANTYSILADANATVDTNGYVHFSTSKGGDYIISVGTLTTK